MSILWVLLVGVIFPSHVMAAYLMRINSQAQFDALNNNITQAIASGHQDIQIMIGPGVYFYHENHLERKNEQQPGVSIRITGQQAILVAAGNDYHNGDIYKGDFHHANSFVNIDTQEFYDCWSDCVFADSLIRIVNEKDKLCFLPYSKAADFMSDDASKMYITITEWFRGYTFKVQKVSSNGIYFVADNLAYIKNFGTEEYNVNYDYIYGRQLPRFSLCNPADKKNKVRISNGKVWYEKDKRIHECLASCFLHLSDNAYKSFTLSGLHFIGNKGRNQLLQIFNTKAEQIVINSCLFEGIRNLVLSADQTDNLLFKENRLSNCSSFGIRSSNSCGNTTVIDNEFDHIGKDMSQTSCVCCKGSNYYVAHNTFRNFGYSAIDIGVWYRTQKEYPSFGIVEYNHIFYDSDYLKHKERHTLMDSGAIYTCTQNDDATIRYNYIHDYAGMRHNRGIFCDDGASHLRIYGNIVINTSHHAIDSRLCPNINENNLDNQVMYNIVNSSILFQGKDIANNQCVRKGNITLFKVGGNTPKHIYGSIEHHENDMFISYEGWDNKGIIVNQETWNHLRRLPYFKHIKQYIRRK